MNIPPEPKLPTKIINEGVFGPRGIKYSSEIESEDQYMSEYSYEDLIELEQQRQNKNVELIASENFCSERVRKACGSILTNKYAEGYSGKRYYGGCENIDLIETKAIEDACKLFDCKYANVQPHCGSSANMAVIRTLIKPGDTILSMDLGAGGHLSHGHKMSFSGQDYRIVPYGLNDNGEIDFEDFTRKLYDEEPDLIIVGASSYSKIIDYSKFFTLIECYKLDKELSKEGAPYFMVDMAHVAGLVAGGVHPNPCLWADVVTSTTHKTLRGPRGGLILTQREDLIKKIDRNVFPGIQGGPLEHIICAKGICFEEALRPEFKGYAHQVIKNAHVFAQTFINEGWKVISNGTENHMFILDVYNSIGLTGQQAETYLDKINITVNKNQIWKDTLPPLKSSGIRIGTPAMTTKGWNHNKFAELAEIMMQYLSYISLNEAEESVINDYAAKVSELVEGE